MRIHTIAAAILIVGAPLASRAQSTALKDSLVTLEKNSWVAWQKRDGDYFSNFLSDDHVELGPNGAQGKNGVVAGVGSKACVVNSYTVDRFTLTQFSPTTALLVYHAEQDTACGAAKVPSPAWVSSLYVLRNGKWLNAAYQQTVDTKR